MADVISRQAAIDEVNRLAEFFWETWHEYAPSTIAVTDALKEIPSAQQWIPVEEETPILPNIVLVCDSLGKILFDSYIDGVWAYCPYVVAWMPLPEPSKKK